MISKIKKENPKQKNNDPTYTHASKTCQDAALEKQTQTYLGL